MKIQPIRGTRDLIGDQARLYREIEAAFAQLAQVYDFTEIETPILEPTATFSRTLGETTDIVNKEMYTFDDRGGESVTMRPEGTASVARAVISNGLQRETPLKLFYRGPMFRYERPQKGRYRQFYQFGVEMVGVAQPVADVEVLALADQLFKELGLCERVQLEINSIGDDESRNQYRQALVDYLIKNDKELSEDSRKRLNKNPLRVLDSKDEKDQKIVAQAPRFIDHLNGASRDNFKEVTDQLDQLKISYTINHRLVRGLDYYNNTVWEFTTKDLGSQNAVLSGGRYDKLVESMGGQSLPGVGWAAGTDRFALLLEKPKSALQSVGIVPVDEVGAKESLNILQTLRQQRIPAQIFYSGNMTKQLKKADKRGCFSALLVGGSEWAEGKVVKKDLATGEQTTIAVADLVSVFSDKGVPS